MLLRRCLEIANANMIKLIDWWHKWAIREAANIKMLVTVSCLDAGKL